MYDLIINGMTHHKKYNTKSDALRHANAYIEHGEDINGDKINSLCIREYDWDQEGSPVKINIDKII